MTTTTKKVDKLGRLVLPADIRKLMGINAFSEINMFFENGTLHITSSKRACKICGAVLHISSTIDVCRVCIQKIKEME